MATTMCNSLGYRSMHGHSPLLGVLGILSLLAVGAPSCYAEDVAVKVDFGTQLGAPTHRATGWIYGLSEDGTQPAQSFQGDIKAQFFRAGGAQLGCPNSGWSNGGYSGYVRRWNSVKAYYQRAKAVGATLVLLPHDLWGADLVCNVPVWPGDNGDWTNFDNFVDQLVKDAVASGMTGPDVHWDIWNEPDCCGFWEGHRDQRQYLEMWKRAFKRIRAAIPNAVIVGPSTSGQPSPGWGWFTTYLDYVKANNVVPDYISWHELNTGSDPVNSKDRVASMLSGRGMSVRGYQVNEYGSPSEQTAGDTAWYIARLERAGIDGARANWGMYGGLYETMGELVVNSGGHKPLGAWWVYKRYGEMTGKHIGVTGASSVDGVAAADPAAQKAIIVLGSRNSSGKVTVNVGNIPSYLVANGQTHVLVERMPETNGAPVSAPTVIRNEDVNLNNNQLSVPISWSNSSDAYVLTLTSGNSSTPPEPPPPGQDVGVSLSAAGGNGRVDLNWTTKDNLRAVQVMRDTDPNPSGRQRIAILSGKLRSYTDTKVTNGRQYWYWIKHTNTSGVTANSDSATATPSGGNSQPIGVTGVSVSPTSSTLAVGSTTTLSANVTPNNATNKSVTWSTSNAGVAKVSANGVVTGVAKGTATITVKTADGNRTASSAVTVTAESSTPPPTPGDCAGPAVGTHGSNPIMPGIYTADPAVLVHDCTFYITAGHDEGTNGFYMRDWYVLSSTDMVNWTDNGHPALSLDVFRWADANAWAGQMVKRNGKFYWYVPVNERGGGMAIGVAVGDSPLGPFHDAIGAPLINDAIEMRQFNYSDAGQTVFTIDPTVFVDDNGQAYLAYGGFGRMVTVALGDNMISLKGNMVERSPQGFFEAPYLTKRNGTYYMVYAAGVNPATIDYATSNSPTGPWQYRGRILDALTGLPGQDAPTSHPAIAEFAGQWYLVYHLSNGPGGGTYRRQVAIDKLTFNADGTIQKVKPSSGLSFDYDNTGNRAPVAKVKSVANVLAGGTVTLDGSASSDPNGDTLSYRWMQTQGSRINLADSTARTLSFAAPAVTQPTSFAFQLTVSDGSLSDTASAAFQVTPVSDTTAPAIVSRVPQSNQSGVGTATAISVTFNEVLREDRINNQSLQVTENGNPVTGVVTYNSANRTITTKLSRALTAGTRYTVTLAGNLQDLAGNAASGESWSFTTASDNNNPVGNCDFSEPPANVAAWINESWNAQLTGNISSRKAWLLDSAMKGKGEINLCVRWGASRAMTTAIRDQIAPAMERWFNGWFTALGSYGCFPYPKGVKVKLTGVAVKPNQKSLLQWNDNSVPIYTETDGEGEPKCPDACSFFENWSHEFPGCSGGEAKHFDYSVWLNDTIGGGAGAVGGDWGVRMPVASFVDVLNQPSDHTIQHEMGHGFGMQDYYDWTGSTPAGGSAMIVGSNWGNPVITTGDTWLVRRIWKEQKAQRGW